MDRIRYCINLIKHCDKNLHMHCLRTAYATQLITKYLGKEDKLLYKAGLIHDIGKVATSRSILDAPRKLTGQERNLIDLHSYLGYCMLENLHVDKEICQLVLFHHGFDKPFGELNIAPDKRTIERVKILRCADGYEALISDRSYCKGIPSREALDIMYNSDEFDNMYVEVIENVVLNSHKVKVS